MGKFNYSMKALVAWRGGLFFDRKKDWGVVFVCSIYNAGGSVCGCQCMCVYGHTHTHTSQMGYLVVSPSVGTRHLEGPKNPVDHGLNLGIYVFVYVTVYTKYTRVCVC